MDSEKVTQILRVSKMYYEMDMPQAEIAKKEGISNSTVSRLLKAGKESGLIEVRIKEPMLSFSELEAQFLSRFPIQKVTIVPDLVENPQITLQDVCSALIDDLPRYIENGSILGVAWGNTLELLSTMLKPIRRENVSVIQLTGGYSKAPHESSALQILNNFVQAVAGSGYIIPVPAMVDQPFIADAIKQDSQVRNVLEMAEHCQTAIFSVGSFQRPSVIYEMGLLSEEQYFEMEKEGCVGDCCSHFLNAQGEIFDEEMDKRVVGTSLETIRKIPNKLLIASGKDKAPVILGALRGGLADHLYIDAPTAQEVLNLSYVPE